MDRKQFFSMVGIGVGAIIIEQCLSGCAKSTTSTTVDFTLDVSSGALAQNGGYLVQNGVIVARTQSGNYIAVSAACTHEGQNVTFTNGRFYCSRHGATFSETGAVTNGPANTPLTKYLTSLTGTSLRVYSA